MYFLIFSLRKSTFSVLLTAIIYSSVFLYAMIYTVRPDLFLPCPPGVVSACANPVLYGLLNENFKTEYRNLFEAWRGKLLDIKL